jgi:hypothetical protein
MTGQARPEPQMAGQSQSQVGRNSPRLATVGHVSTLQTVAVTDAAAKFVRGWLQMAGHESLAANAWPQMAGRE